MDPLPPVPRELETRREFLKQVPTAAAIAAFPGRAIAGELEPELPELTRGAPVFFTDRERKVLGSLCDAILPGSAASGAVRFIETLLSAFDYSPPRVYAGGPFSGRGAGPGATNDFEVFIPLTRHQEADWRLKLYGDGREWGWRDLFKREISAARRRSMGTIGWLPRSLARSVLKHLDPTFQDLVLNWTLEASLGAPEYGGNKDLAGWGMAAFEGDRLPQGYSVFDPELGTTRDRDPNHPVAFYNPGPDARELSWTTRIVFWFTAHFRNGRMW